MYETNRKKTKTRMRFRFREFRAVSALSASALNKIALEFQFCFDFSLKPDTHYPFERAV